MILPTAGHYPESPGACFYTFCEHEEADKWINIIAYFLREQTHVDKVPTGKLTAKVNWINDYALEKVKLAIEVHFKIGKHTSELQSQSNLVCRLLLEKK